MNRRHVKLSTSSHWTHCIWSCISTCIHAFSPKSDKTMWNYDAYCVLWPGLFIIIYFNEWYNVHPSSVDVCLSINNTCIRVTTDVDNEWELCDYTTVIQSLITAWREVYFALVCVCFYFSSLVAECQWSLIVFCVDNFPLMPNLNAWELQPCHAGFSCEKHKCTGWRFSHFAFFFPH